MRGLEPGDALAVVAGASKKIHLDARVGSKPSCVSCSCEIASATNHGANLIERRQLDADVAREVCARRVARGSHDLAAGSCPPASMALASISDCTSGGVDLVEIDLHDERLRVRGTHRDRRRERVVARAQRVNRAEHVDGVVLAVQLPERMQRCRRRWSPRRAAERGAERRSPRDREISLRRRGAGACASARSARAGGVAHGIAIHPAHLGLDAPSECNAKGR